MDDETERKETDDFFEHFARFITEMYGDRCKETEGGCICCSMWAAYDLVNAMVCRP